MGIERWAQVNAGRFNFSGRERTQPLSHLPADELATRARERFPALVETWRNGGPQRTQAAALLRRFAGAGYSPGQLERYPRVLEFREDLRCRLLEEELAELGVESYGSPAPAPFSSTETES